MATTMNFTKVQAYLDAIANEAAGDIGQSPHQNFWTDYHTFINGNVPGGARTTCPIGSNTPIRIIDPNDASLDKTRPLTSPFYVILTNAIGFCARKQMPQGGPFITAGNYQVTLADGTVVTGAKIMADLEDWLRSGFPQ
jgi:hypothetical protein